MRKCEKVKRRTSRDMEKSWTVGALCSLGELEHVPSSGAPASPGEYESVPINRV